MRELPLGHPGTPDLRSPTRFLLWVARGQLGTLALGMAYGVVWMGALAVVPALVGRAIDLGVAEGDTAGLLRWSALILAAGLVSAIAGILRHRVAVVNWLTATYRVQQLLVRQAVRLGASLPRRVPTGEVAAVGVEDGAPQVEPAPGQREVGDGQASLGLARGEKQVPAYQEERAGGAVADTDAQAGRPGRVGLQHQRDLERGLGGRRGAVLAEGQLAPLALAGDVDERPPRGIRGVDGVADEAHRGGRPRRARLILPAPSARRA
jgi:hypothetical protein